MLIAFVLFFLSIGIIIILAPALGVIKIVLTVLTVAYGVKKLKEIITRNNKEKETTEKELKHHEEQISKAIGSIGIDTSFKCSSCGSVIPFNKEKTATFCPFCGAPIKNAEEFITASLQHFENQQKREFELEKHRIELEKIRSQERENARNDRFTTICLVGIIICALGMLFFANSSTP